MATKLTPDFVKKAPPPTRDNHIFYDTDVKGFGVRVTAAGAKSFIYNYRNSNGRERRFTIGRYPDWTVTAARQEARELAKAVDRGEDPQGNREFDRAAPTIEDLVKRYIADFLPTKRPRSQVEDLAMINSYILPALKHRKVVEVDHDDVVRLHRQVTNAGKPVRANRTLALLSRMFAIASLPGKNQWRSDNPCKGVTRNPEENRERYLKSDEIARLMKVLIEYPDRESANAIMLALLTGARQGELLSAEWSQFDLVEGVWTKPSSHTKQKRTHRVPLSPEAIELLTAMRDKAPKGEAHVFPGRISDAGNVNIRWHWVNVRRDANIPDVRFHDLRHSFASMLASAGLSLPIIGRLLGHTQHATTARYAHLGDGSLRAATAHVGKLVAGNGK